jgi:hypothetical protein
MISLQLRREPEYDHRLAFLDPIGRTSSRLQYKKYI